MDRYHRQTLLPHLGRDGQARLRAGRVLLVGLGALGSTIAEHLTRAGVGQLTLVDRDVVEWTNLQRQALYDEADARRGAAKAEAAARRLGAVNADVRLTPLAIDVDAGNVGGLVDAADVVLDGTDNAETRYLLNDACVRRGVPWVMGASVGVEGRVMPIVPGVGPCLRCVFRDPPAAGELATCDTAGVLGPAAAVVASLQAVAAIRLLVGDRGGLQLTTLDAWAGRFRTIDLADARRDDCPCCGLHRFEFLDRPAGGGARLCGRDAVSVRPGVASRVDLDQLATRLRALGEVDVTPLMLKFAPSDTSGLTMNVFRDGRALVFGTDDLTVARSAYARVVGI